MFHTIHCAIAAEHALKNGEFSSGSGMGSLFNSSALGGAGKRDSDGDDIVNGVNVSSLSAKNVDFTSMSGSGIAMKLKFEALNAFRRYRRVNEEELLRIAMKNQRGTLEYRVEMQRFKEKAIKQVVDTFFGVGPDAT